MRLGFLTCWSISVADQVAEYATDVDAVRVDNTLLKLNTQVAPPSSDVVGAAVPPLSVSRPLHLVELFAGAGGLAQGFERAGRFETAALYDISKPARDAYKSFKPKAVYRALNVRHLQRRSVYNDLDGRLLHGILGGPPCQGFSIAGKRNHQAETNELIRSYARKVDTLEPFFLVLENVPQLLFHTLFQPLLKKLSTKYLMTYGVLNAARYGTPQTRHRLILIAYHRSLGIQPTLPQPTHGLLNQQLYAYDLMDSSRRVQLTAETAKMIFGADPVIHDYINVKSADLDLRPKPYLLPLVKVGDAISDLSAAEHDKPITYASEPASAYQRFLRTNQHEVHNCLTRKHIGRPLEIALTLREGGTPSKEPGELFKRYYSQAYARLHREGLARTLTTYFMNAGSGRFMHYAQPRTLTVREAARLQGFTDDFIFTGNLQEQMQVVGNAVPLPLAEAIGRHVLAEIGDLL
jgi:DNA (cytosine-5)-methyltransferase 1